MGVPVGWVTNVAGAAAFLGALPESANTPSAETNFFLRLREANAALLNVGYADRGWPAGRPFVLLHGWPYDIHSYVDVAPHSLLRVTGRSCRTRVGTAKFHSKATLRNAQQLRWSRWMSSQSWTLSRLRKAILGEVSGLVMPLGDGGSVAGALQSSGRQRLSDRQPGSQPPAAAPPAAEWGWWYQACLRLRKCGGWLQRSRMPSTGELHRWKNASPKWNFATRRSISDGCGLIRQSRSRGYHQAHVGEGRIEIRSSRTARPRPRSLCPPSRSPAISMVLLRMAPRTAVNLPGRCDRTRTALRSGARSATSFCAGGASMPGGSRR